MINEKKLLKKLHKDIEKLEKHLEHRKLYNFRNFIVNLVIKSGIAIDYTLPFILAGTIIFYQNQANGNNPFKADEIHENANVETIITSTGLKKSSTSFDYQYENDESVFEHSTAWSINNYGLYERTVTYYKINEDIDLSDIDKVLMMPKEELDNLFSIIDIRVIQKNILDSEDELYNEDMVNIRYEDSSEIFVSIIIYLISTLFEGAILYCLKKNVCKNKFRNNLRRLNQNFIIIREDEIYEIRKILDLRKENIKLLDGTYYNSLDENDEKRDYQLVKRLVNFENE